MEKRAVVIGTIKGMHKCSSFPVTFKLLNFGSYGKKLCTSCENYA